MASKAKLQFISTCETLKSPVECNTIPQVLIQFNYVERWGEHRSVKEGLPEDSKNIKDFFIAIRKMSDSGFQTKKFYELWAKHNMEDITDYYVVRQVGDI